MTKGEALDTEDGIQAHAGQQDAGGAQDQALEHIAAGDGHHHGQAEQGQHAVLGGVEGDGEPGDGGGEQHQADGGEEATDEGVNNVYAQRQAALALTVQGVAVKGLGDGGGSAGGVDQDGGDTAGKNGGIPKAHQHGESVGRIKPEGNGGHDGNTHGGGQAGQRADGGADHHAQGQEQDNRGL